MGSLQLPDGRSACTRVQCIGQKKIFEHRQIAVQEDKQAKAKAAEEKQQREQEAAGLQDAEKEQHPDAMDVDPSLQFWTSSECQTPFADQPKRNVGTDKPELVRVCLETIQEMAEAHAQAAKKQTSQK